MSRFVLVLFFLVVSFISVISASVAGGSGGAATTEDKSVEKVICNVILFVQKLGLPIMTGVILGSSIMAIFGKLPWPAIVMLVVFTAIFFGAGKLIAKFANGVNGVEGNFDCTTIASGN
ncbi:TrbC/VirB2 family protein [Ehrlichia sp. JZT12]